MNCPLINNTCPKYQLLTTSSGIFSVSSSSVESWEFIASRPWTRAEIRFLFIKFSSKMYININVN